MTQSHGTIPLRHRLVRRAAEQTRKGALHLVREGP